MKIRDIAILNLKRRKARAAFVWSGWSSGVATTVALVGLAESLTHEINDKLEKFGANIRVTPKSDQLNLSYGGLQLGQLLLQDRGTAPAGPGRHPYHQERGQRGGRGTGGAGAGGKPAAGRRCWPAWNSHTSTPSSPGGKSGERCPGTARCWPEPKRPKSWACPSVTGCPSTAETSPSADCWSRTGLRTTSSYSPSCRSLRTC